jgi:adenylate cyclase
MRGQLGIARDVAQQLLAHAAATEDPEVLLGAHNVMGMCLFYGGELERALEHFERAAAFHDPERHRPHRQFSIDHDPGVSCGAHTALTLMMLGYQDRAETRMRECLAEARSIDHPLSFTMACNFASTMFQFRRERSVVEELEEIRDEYATKHDFELFRLLGEIYRGWLVAESGRVEEGIAQIRGGLAMFQAIGAGLGRPTFLAILAEMCSRVGNRNEALDLVNEAVALAESTGLHYWDGELRRLRGTFLLTTAAGRRSGAADERQAESCFLEAIEIARRQQAKGVELRAATSLARLWQRQGKTTEARGLLADVFGWFTEGFGTPDLIDAKALLDDLDGATAAAPPAVPKRPRRRGE